MHNKHEKRTQLYFLSFVIPIVMMLFICICLHIFPFGSNTILFSDINNQFISFYSYFKSIITGNDNFIYTFSKNLGGDMVGFSGYYLQNPFLFLLLLFPEKYLTFGILVSMILQIGFCGLTFEIYLLHTNEVKKETLIFSTAYAFLGYLFAYFTLPIYFCSIILLPLVILGIYKIVHNPKKKALYILSLAGAVFCNYYLGYMICIFSLLFFMYFMVIDIKQNSKPVAERMGAFIVSSLLGVGITAFDLIPIALSLRGQKNAPEASVLSLYRNFNFRDVFSKLYTGAFDGNVSNSSMPYIYVSMICAAFVILYFFNKEIELREKLCSGIFILFMLGCCYIHTTDVIWHAFNEPVGFAYRYAFLIGFLLLHVAYQGFIKFDAKVSSYLPVVIIYVIYSCYLLFLSHVNISFQAVIFDFIIIVFVGILLIVQKNFYLPLQIGFILIFLIQGTDLICNSMYSLKQYDNVSQEEYSAYIDRVKPVIDKIEKEDSSFYRVEKNFQRNLNDAMQFSYHGLTHNSSCEKDYVKNFEANMGFRNFGIWAFYNEGSTTFSDCFLGVKYFISRFDTTNKPFIPDFHTSDTYVFENPYVMPLVFGMNKEVLNVNMKQENLFKIQNDIAQCFSTSAIKDIYTEAEYKTENLVNLTEEKQQYDGKEVSVYKKTDTEKEAYIEYEIIASGNHILYYYFAAPKEQGAEIFVNDYSYGDYFSNWRWNIMNAGNYKAGEKVNIKLYVTGDELSLYNCYFYEENQSALETWYAAASIDKGQLNKISSSHLKGTIDLENKDYVVFSIPYEKGWNIKIDGKKVNNEKVLEALLGIELSKGSHSIDMYYVPEGFIIGMIIMILSLLIFIGIQIFGNSKRNNMI